MIEHELLFLGLSKEGEAVPISSPKEIEELKSSFMPPKKREIPYPQR